MLATNEQLFLELVNAARLDPLGEAARQGIGLDAGLAPGTMLLTNDSDIASMFLCRDILVPRHFQSRRSVS